MTWSSRKQIHKKSHPSKTVQAGNKIGRKIANDYQVYVSEWKAKYKSFNYIPTTVVKVNKSRQ